MFNPPVGVLEDLIESVLDQTYSNFELCLGNFGDSKEVVALLEKYAKLDSRIKHYIFTSNDGIAENSNQILKKVKGEYIALLDHDDSLSPDALYENVKMINQQDYDFLYSDKDKVDISGNRFDPLFKPQLSPEMLLNINYLTHLNVMRTSLVKKIGGWDSQTDGAQDWDLFLRILEVSNKIAHIPKVLYHWRVIESSTAMSIESKPYALAGQRKAIDKHLKVMKIPAKAFHKKTELFLEWNTQVIDKKPWVYIYFSNISNTLRTIRHIRRSIEKPKFIVLINSSLGLDAISRDKLVRAGVDISLYNYSEATFFSTIRETLNTRINSDHTALFIQDVIRLPKKNEWYSNLMGWLTVSGVAAAGGRLVDRDELIVDSGGMISKDRQYLPIFQKYPRYYESYLGNAEWIRNLSILSSNFFVTRTSTMKEFHFAQTIPRNPGFDDFFLWGSQKYRIVMIPHVTASVYEDRNLNIAHRLRAEDKKAPHNFIDRFGNSNMSNTDPLRLSLKDPSINRNVMTTHTNLSDYQHDATILASSFDITGEEIQFNQNLVKNSQLVKRPESVAWFLPSYDSVYAGLMNIFSFANYLNSKQKLQTTIYILKNTKSVSDERAQAVKAFPKLKSAKFVAIRPDQIDAIKPHDIGIATQWATAYPLAKARNIARKWYFIQDNEANFYPKGSISALVELSYQFGFSAVANTAGLLDLYKKKYKGSGVVVKSLVDLNAYFPRSNAHYVPKKPYRVFFYARPNMPRNAFELGIAGLKVLKKQLGDDVEVITAGADWGADLYGVAGLFTNLGKISYEAVPRLYRSVDAGLMFMFSGHPGVTASELMASGCPVVVNEYNDITWHELYKNEVTCLVTKATASEVARNLIRCLEDTQLRKVLISNGLKVATEFYKGYDASCDKAFTYLVDATN